LSIIAVVAYASFLIGPYIEFKTIDGKKMTAQEVEALAKLPSRDQLLSMVLNSMLGPIRKLAYVTTAIIDKKEA
jgi:ribosomal protein L10